MRHCRPQQRVIPRGFMLPNDDAVPLTSPVLSPVRGSRIERPSVVHRVYPRWRCPSLLGGAVLPVRGGEVGRGDGDLKTEWLVGVCRGLLKSSCNPPTDPPRHVPVIVAVMSTAIGVPMRNKPYFIGVLQGRAFTRTRVSTSDCQLFLAAENLRFHVSSFGMR